ncbi:MAG: M23 family metallopeptidase [Cytophagaceae bacterium]
MFPINPGQRNYLSANMGELRPNHFHGGMDVKTGGVTGLPIYCAADGYVSRLKVSTYGYGKTLYITHPNGLTTVYAHIDRFNPTIAGYALQQQYALQNFDIDINLAPGTLVLKKGDIIAYSGNSGSSGGPHLHWEIRTPQEYLLDPMRFGFSEIIDTQTPVFDKIAISAMDMNARVSGEMGRKEFTPVIISGSKYRISEKITANGLIGIEIKTHDRMNDTHNSYGITCIEVKVDGRETFFHNLETFHFYENRYINVHVDYETMIAKGQRFERCYVADGNNLACYLMNPDMGKIRISEDKLHEVEIRIYDASGNMSVLNFQVQGKKAPEAITSTVTPTPSNKLMENTLKIVGSANSTTCALYIKSKGVQTLTPAYKINTAPVYLYDMRLGLPDSVQAGTYKEVFDYVATIYPGKQTYVNDNLTLQFSDSTLFDTLYLRVKNHIPLGGSETFEINNPTVPVFGPIGVIYCPKDSSFKMNKCYFYNINNSSTGKYEGGEWTQDTISHQLKYLGKYKVSVDQTPPTITYRSHTAKRINFNIFDRESGIGSIKATLNGEWVLMNYEHKTGVIWSEFLDKNKTLTGKFVLEVTDKGGNVMKWEKIL